ncbi:exonuclease domain-containing protein [uncultured Clostridium sp.]|mgnify:CR=1 FL=1|uniref:exonuclease domain-containing protein n=1 Tax=uncultured Clostridium sp. TaxID=59620 RepID=UPI0025D139EC|nr:exonuclease domain-containing protein [uncultured Clostridium sp.]
MNFIAIDFETANEKRSSPCSIGLVVVRDNEIIEKMHYLIKPNEMRFMPINIGIHGIRPGMVENEPEFDVIWNKISHYFENSLIIAHNASFDISVIRRTLELYDIKPVSFEYVCTMKLARNFYPQIENAKLNTVNRFLGYEFNHHDALADALACSNILLKISEELETEDINEICRLTGVTIGTVNEEGYKPSSSKGRILKKSDKVCSATSRNLFENLNYDAFKDEVVVFTGSLSSITRNEAVRIVTRLGGICGSSVTKKTTMLVSNVNNIDELKRNEMSTKMRKACDLQSKGQKIIFIDEDEFIKKMKNNA